MVPYVSSNNRLEAYAPRLLLSFLMDIAFWISEDLRGKTLRPHVEVRRTKKIIIKDLKENL